MLHFLGYFSAILIGISLGLIGGGGAILTVPVLLYIFGKSAETATGYSMFIVGATSLAGSVTFLKNKLVDLRITALFGIPAVIVGFVTRKYLLHAIPAVIFTIGNYSLSKNVALIILFALLMIFASYTMISDKDYSKWEKEHYKFYEQMLALGFQGTIIGLLGGLLGVGGGFLIVPTLVIFSALPIQKAIGTSLMIISFNMLIMFTAVLTGSQEIEWPFLLFFTSLAILGIILGSYFAKHIPGKKLKPAFGVFILIMGIYILVKELMK